MTFIFFFFVIDLQRVSKTLHRITIKQNRLKRTLIHTDAHTWQHLHILNLSREHSRKLSETLHPIELRASLSYINIELGRQTTRKLTLDTHNPYKALSPRARI